MKKYRNVLRLIEKRNWEEMEEMATGMGVPKIGLYQNEHFDKKNNIMSFAQFLPVSAKYTRTLKN